MSKITALQHMGLAFETQYGTAVTPTFFVPITSMKPADDIKKIIDEGRRANVAKTFGVYDGIASSSLDFDCDLYPDAVGYLLKAILGAEGTPSGTAGNYTHTFQLQNALSPSLTVGYFNALAQHQMTGSILSELDIKFDTEDVLTMSAKMIGQKSTVLGAPLTPIYSTVSPFMGWGSQLQIGAVSNINLVGGEIDFKRESKLLYGANNSQNPNKYSAGRLDASFKLTFDVEDETELNLLGGADQKITLTFNQDANTQLQFVFNKCDVAKATVDTSQEFARVDLELTPIYNVTDNGVVTVTLKNAIASY